MTNDEEFTRQNEDLALILSLVTTGCLLFVIESYQLTKQQNCVLVSSISDILGIDEPSENDCVKLTHTIIDQLSTFSPYKTDPSAHHLFCKGQRLPQEVREYIIRTCMLFKFSGHSRDEEGMRLIGELSRDIGLENEKIPALLDDAIDMSSHYMLMTYSNEYDESMRLITSALQRLKININSES